MVDLCLGKFGISEDNVDDGEHKFLMKHILQLEAEIASLKQQLEQERNQFSSYTEQISKLNEAREELILEYEAREREMQQEIFSMKQQLQSYRNSETKDMLINQGLVDIADSTPGQQVAYLLVDRARLMDVIEELKERIVLGQSSLNNTTVDRQKDVYSGNFKRHTDGSESDKLSVTIEELISKVQHLEINNRLLTEKLIRLSPQEYEEFTGGASVLKVISEKPPSNTKSSNSIEVFKTPATIEEAIERLKTAEKKVEKIELLEKQLLIKEEELKKLMTKLEFVRAGHATMGSKDVADEGVISRDEQTSSELYLKHSEKIELVLKSVEEQLKNMKISSEQKKSDEEASVSSGHLHILQKDFELLKVELEKMISKCDIQASKYRDHKFNCMKKLFKLKETFKKEKQEMSEKIDELHNRLELNREVMDREVEYKKNLEKTIQNLISEQKNFITQISMQEETILNQKREINLLMSKNKHLQNEMSSSSSDKHFQHVTQQYTFSRSSNAEQNLSTSQIPSTVEKK